MLVIPRLKHLTNLRNSGGLHATKLASFHSTSACDEKWKNKWNNTFSEQSPSKSYMKYQTRQKRADDKRSLKAMLIRGLPFARLPQPSQIHNQPRRKKGKNSTSNSKLEDDEDRSKSSRSEKIKSKQRRKQRKEYLSEDDEPEMMFRAKYGSNWSAWSFNAFHSSSSYNNSSGFSWKENTDNGGEQVGSYSDRTILGLPPHGSLKIDDLKNAFRISALKWHPDKHQGSSQAHAEEKFKLCVNAYNSLCSALPPA